MLLVKIAAVGGYRYENSSVYVGEWNKEGLKEGDGHLLFTDGTRYDGTFEDGLFNGLGVILFPDGSK